MTYVFSNLEGSSIDKMIDNITKNDSTDSKTIIITGDILDTTNKDMRIKDLFENKSYNLHNIHYCIQTHSKLTIKLLLGHRDLNKLKLHKLLEIDENNTEIDKDMIKKFNNGEIDITQVCFEQNFDRKIKWKYPLSIDSKDYPSSTEDNVPSDFITRFQSIFTDDAINLLFSIPYEIEKDLTLPSDLLGNKYLDQQTDIYAEVSKPITVTEIYNKMNTRKNCYAFIVCAIFRSLLIKYDTESIPSSFEVTTNSSFCKGWLYTLYTRSNTFMALLINNKYLLSHGGITKYCIAFFSDKTNGETVCRNIDEKNDSDIDFNYNSLSIIDLHNTISLCNSTFKKWIQDSFIEETNKSLLYISYMTTENNQFYSLFGPGLSTLITKKNIQYISINNPIIQIFGHKSFGFANSFYMINDKNMLVCLDISNSFLSTKMNKSYISYNYININNDILTSISNIELDLTNFTLIPYNDNIIDINCNNIDDISKIYYNSSYDINNTNLLIKNIINITDNIIKYEENHDTFNILNTYLNICKNSQLIYNGIYNNTATSLEYFLFSIINNNLNKDFYILSNNDILNIINPNVVIMYIENFINIIKEYIKTEEKILNELTNENEKTDVSFILTTNKKILDYLSVQINVISTTFHHFSNDKKSLITEIDKSTYVLNYINIFAETNIEKFSSLNLKKIELNETSPYEDIKNNMDYYHYTSSVAYKEDSKEDKDFLTKFKIMLNYIKLMNIHLIEFIKSKEQPNRHSTAVAYKKYLKYKHKYLTLVKK